MTNEAEETKFEVKSFIDAAQLKKDLAYSMNDLSTAMAMQSSMFVHYGVLAADASRQVDLIELLLQNAEASIYKMYRKELIDAGEKVTEAMLDKLVTTHQKVRNLKRALIEAKRIEAIGKSAVEAFKQRRDMLIQHGATERQEMQGQVRIRATDLENLKAETLERLRKNTQEHAQS